MAAQPLRLNFFQRRRRLSASQRGTLSWEGVLSALRAGTDVLYLCFEHHINVVHKFLASLILETPLIVLQYYKKPSFSIYIYKDPYKEGQKDI
jgi:hypothetical protein